MRFGDAPFHRSGERRSAGHPRGDCSVVSVFQRRLRWGLMKSLGTIFLFYFCLNFVIFFFHAALVHCCLSRSRGTKPNLNAIRGRHLGVGACILRELGDGSPQTQMQSSGYQPATRALQGVQRRGVAGVWPRSTGGTRHRSIRDVLCCDSKWPAPSKDPESSARENRMLCKESHPYSRADFDRAAGATTDCRDF